MPESTPAVPLSWTMASQYATPSAPTAPGVAFIDTLLATLLPATAADAAGADAATPKWPFASADADVVEDVIYDVVFGADAPQPKTDVQVTFASLHPRFT